MFCSVRPTTPPQPPRLPKVRARTPEEVAVELAAVLGTDRVDKAFGLAAIAGRFVEEDLA
ncbi:hypothetical protein [Prauserella sp. PE36]|uniref:hypothetical protein n=1 Tax=Prauserella sp. PE36 TaxID=1504709 RepID=UPI0011BDEBE7|nr:hypothetical protein [Prauserella sp. PE36]